MPPVGSPRISSRSSRSAIPSCRTSSPTSTWRRPSRSTASSNDPLARTPRPRRARLVWANPCASFGAAVGSGALVGEGPQDRQPHDQRTHRDRRRQAGISACVRPPALPAARRRLLRVVRDRGTHRQGETGQAAVLHPPPRRWTAGDGGPVRDLARPEPRPTIPTRFRWTCTVLTTTAQDDLGHIHDRMPLLVAGTGGRPGSTALPRRDDLPALLGPGTSAGGWRRFPSPARSTP